MSNFSIVCKAKDLRDTLAKVLEMKKEPYAKVQ